MYAIVYTTVPDMKTAEEISRVAVGEGLAACANIHPIGSIYRWKGEVCSEKEVAVTLKTRKEIAGRLMARIKEMHGYDVPCIITWDIHGGEESYLNWIRESTLSG